MTNKIAERSLRPYVVWRKISFFSQFYRGDQFRPLILYIIETSTRLGLSAYQILRRACERGQRGEVVISSPADPAARTLAPGIGL